MKIIKAIQSLVPEGYVTEDEPLGNRTTFKIGGPAEVFVRPTNASELAAVVRTCRENGFPLTILGGGANVLIHDRGVAGVVVHTGELNRISVRPFANCIVADAGVRLSSLAMAAAKAGLSGLAFASGIPGTVGGAVYMNAGAYGCDISDVCECAALLINNRRVVKTREEMMFGYRTSYLHENPEAILLSVLFRLVPGDPKIIQEDMSDLNARRRESQPLTYPSAGSTFKRPPGHFAGKLIEEAGCKGLTVGGAQVSEKHAGFIINIGDATARDVLQLVEEVRWRVHENSGIWLEPEIKVLGG